MPENRPVNAENDAPRRTPNPYDYEDTCTCSAWSPGECGCGGYVDRGQVRACQEGYEAAVRDLTRPIPPGSSDQ